MLKKLALTLLLSCALLLIAAGASGAPRTAPSFADATPSGDGHIIYVPLPAGVSASEALRADARLKAQLDAVVRQALSAEERAVEDTANRDFIIQFTVGGTSVVLPDLERARSSPQLSGDASQQALTAGNDITFTYNSPAYPWSPAELATVSGIVNDCYPQVKAVYGDPAFAITVNLRKDPTIVPFAGFYDVSLNEMVVRSTSPDPICHEMIHAFRDDIILSGASFEEGMTRAAEVEVFNRLAGYTHWDENHSYTYDVYYEGLNRHKIGSLDGAFFYGYVSALLRYQLAGYAWGKVLLENAGFLPAFNAELYTRTLADPSTRFTESKLVDIARSLQSTVEGQLFLEWYARQGVLETNPPNGYSLYQRINQFTVDFFDRQNGPETMQANAPVQWAVYDASDALLDSGTMNTSANGWVNINPTLSGYTGRIRVTATASSPSGAVSDTSFRAAGTEAGIFGIVRQLNTGTISISSLDSPGQSASANVVNGAFSVPALATVRGRFQAAFSGPGGPVISRQFTKDASNYFLFMDPDQDGDGLLDYLDNCSGIPNPDQAASDNDGRGNACDQDDDGDGWSDASDNCPSVPNPEQQNSDADALGDSCDPNDDDDMLPDANETACGSNPLSASSLPERIDTPGDDDRDTLVNEALPAGAEAYDCDGDGFSGAVEQYVFSAANTANDQKRCGVDAWPADVNDDGYSDISDVIPLLNYFGRAVPPEPVRYNIAPDALDGFVDISDVVRMLNYFGKGCA